VSGDCTSKGSVEPWRLVTLEPCHATYALCDAKFDDENWGVGEDNDDLVAGLVVGDYFAFMAAWNNYEGVDFFILQCVKELHIVEDDSRPYDFANYMEKGDEIVIGHYYKQSGRRKSSSVLIKDKGPVFIYFHMVCASKFSMVPVTHKKKGGVTTYTLLNNALE